LSLTDQGRALRFEALGIRVAIIRLVIKGGRVKGDVNIILIGVVREWAL